jgi:hypothetical protein
MKTSDSIFELATALSKAQGEMGGAVKGSDNPFFKSKYADLSSVIAAIKEPFSSNDLSYIQFPITTTNSIGEKFVGVVTRIMHGTGEWIESEYYLPLLKNDPQSVGSAITYARRYSLQAAAGIPAEDDDAEKAMDRSPKKQRMISDKQVVQIYELIALTESNLKQFLKLFGKDSIEKFTEEEYAKAVDLINQKLEKLKEGENASK